MGCNKKLTCQFSQFDDAIIQQQCSKMIGLIMEVQKKDEEEYIIKQTELKQG